MHNQKERVGEGRGGKRTRTPAATNKENENYRDSSRCWYRGDQHSGGSIAEDTIVENRTRKSDNTGSGRIGWGYYQTHSFARRRDSRFHIGNYCRALFSHRDSRRYDYELRDYHDSVTVLYTDFRVSVQRRGRWLIGTRGSRRVCCLLSDEKQQRTGNRVKQTDEQKKKKKNHGIFHNITVNDRKSVFFFFSDTIKTCYQV